MQKRNLNILLQELSGTKFFFLIRKNSFFAKTNQKFYDLVFKSQLHVVWSEYLHLPNFEESSKIATLELFFKG